DSHCNFESNLQKRVAVGSVYKLSGYSLHTLCANFRTSKFPHCLDLTTATQFELQPPTDSPFPLTAFDFVPFTRLDSRMPPCPYLIGVSLFRLHSSIYSLLFFCVILFSYPLFFRSRG
ncbi:hypothetical protein LINPERPRIM_LOCUS2470, partial [Linum perenne]